MPKFLKSCLVERDFQSLLKVCREYFNAKTKIPSKNTQATMERVKLKASELGFRIDTIDGIKIWYEDGWVLIRPSGTEPIVRIFAEAKKQVRAEELMREGRNMVIRERRLQTSNEFL